VDFGLFDTWNAMYDGGKMNWYSRSTGYHRFPGTSSWIRYVS